MKIEQKNSLRDLNSHFQQIGTHYTLPSDTIYIMNYRGRRPTKLILKGTPEELASFTAKKILLIATYYTDLPIFCEAATSEECTQLSHLARSFVMLVVFHNCAIDDDDDEVIAVATSRAMMKTIASVAVNTADHIATSRRGLTEAPNIVEEAMIDGWLSFVWNSVDLPFQAALLLLKDETRATTAAAEKEGLEENLKIALKKIETHLSKQESCVPLSKNNTPLSIVATTCSSSMKSCYTLADLSLAATLHFMVDKNIAVSAMSSEENPHLYSWQQNIHRALGLVPDIS